MERSWILFLYDLDPLRIPKPTRMVLPFPDLRMNGGSMIQRTPAGTTPSSEGIFRNPLLWIEVGQLRTGLGPKSRTFWRKEVTSERVAGGTSGFVSDVRLQPW